MQKQFGDKLKELRLEKKMTQEELAKIFNTGKATISHYEGNRRLPDVNTILRYADFFNVSLDYIMGKDKQKASPEKELFEICLSGQKVKEEMSIFSERLKELMFQRDLTAEAVSKEIQLEKSEFIRVANGSNVPTPAIVKKIAAVLNTTADYLFGIVDVSEYEEKSKDNDSEILSPDYVEVAKSAQDKKVPAKILSDFIKIYIDRKK
ncbi:MAG: helix-turn-helix domain-containing protein [Clostridiales bacterium]